MSQIGLESAEYTVQNEPTKPDTTAIQHEQEDTLTSNQTPPENDNILPSNQDSFSDEIQVVNKCQSESPSQCDDVLVTDKKLKQNLEVTTEDIGAGNDDNALDLQNEHLENSVAAVTAIAEVSAFVSVSDDSQVQAVPDVIQSSLPASAEADAYKPLGSIGKPDDRAEKDEGANVIPTDISDTVVTDIHATNSCTDSNDTLPGGDGSGLVVALPDVSSTDIAGGVTDQDAEGATCGAAALVDDEGPIQSVYHVKWVVYKGNSTAIVTQNENGPCPLIAIINVLLLQGKIKLPALVQIVTSGQLMEYLGDCILEQAPKNISEDAQLNYEQNMHDAMAIFHKLQTGLDVNVKFTGIGDFEYTPECIVFDLLAIPLYHGWLVDPESPEVCAAIGNCSYNQLVEKIIVQKNSDKEELVTEGLIAENFLERTAAQLTYHGLSELSTSIKEEELCVFFRNNHFSTLYKHKNELFLLVTDQGFLTEANVVWETLSNVEGDCHFVDASFRTFTKPEPVSVPTPALSPGSDQQIDHDYLVALSLQQEQQMEDEQEVAWQQAQQQQQQQQQPPEPLMGQDLSDHDLAMKLQAEEDRKAAAMQQQHQQQQMQQQQLQAQQQRRQSQDREKKKSDCTIL